MLVFVGKAGVVVHEGVAAVDADDAERAGRVGATALRKADVIAGRSVRVRDRGCLVRHEGGGGRQDGGKRQEMMHGAASFCWRLGV